MKAIIQKLNYAYILIFLIFIIGCLLSVSLFLYIDKQNKTELEQRFDINSNERLMFIEKTIESQISVLTSVVAFYDSSNVVDRGEFKSFVTRLFQSDGYAFQAIEWIPRILLSERKKYEKLAVEEGMLDFHIKEKSENGLVIAKERNVYFPVYFVEPYKGNESAVGFDLASNAARESALYKARDTENMVTSGKINLVQLTKNREGILFFYPIYHKNKIINTIKQRRQQLRGFVLGVIKVKSLISNKYRNENNNILKPMGIDFYTYDLNAQKKESLLYIHNSRARTDLAPSLSIENARTGIYFERIIDVGDRKWSVIARPIQPDLFYSTSIQNWVLLFFCLAATLLITLYLYTLSSRSRVVNALVETKTKELLQSENRQRTILEAMTDAVITIDSKGIIMSFNPAAENTFGYQSNEIIGQDVSVLMNKNERIEHMKYTENSTLYSSRIINSARELNGLRKDMTTFPLEINVARLSDDAQQGFVGVLRDISQRKKTELELIAARKNSDKANKAKSEFLSSMSHELRTPLNAILGFSQILEMDAKDDIDRENSQEIINAGEHLLSLIEEILDLSKIESKAITLSIENICLSEILNDTLTLINPIAQKHSVQIDNKINSTFNINVDKKRFKQTLLNLLSNAIKYNTENGKVIIDCSLEANNMLCLSISDTGTGLTAEQLSNLFNPFDRLGAENTNIEGTGLGLKISKDLIELMGGTITVESSIGKGSKFSIHVPLS